MADVAALAAGSPAVFRLAASRTQAAAEAFALDRAADRLRVYLAQAVASDAAWRAGRVRPRRTAGRCGW